MEQLYISQLSDMEKIVLKIAQEHLETSFSLEKSIGFKSWLALQAKQAQVQVKQTQVQVAQVQVAPVQVAQVQVEQTQVEEKIIIKKVIKKKKLIM